MLPTVGTGALGCVGIEVPSVPIHGTTPSSHGDHPNPHPDTGSLGVTGQTLPPLWVWTPAIRGQVVGDGTPPPAQCLPIPGSQPGAPTSE